MAVEASRQNSSRNQVNISLIRTIQKMQIYLELEGIMSIGEEAFAPVNKENVVQTHIPEPKHRAKFIVTHNEYELMQAQMTLPHDGYRLFNPTIFVAGDWRKDLPSNATESWIMGAHNHPCNNKTDEEQCIALHKLHYTQHLLELKLQFMHQPGKYDKYIEVMQENYR